MKFSTYFSASVLLMMGTVYYAFYTYRQFYPTVLFLVSSKLSYVVIGNMVFAVGLLIAKIFKTLFFGQLRDTEVEHLVDTANSQLRVYALLAALAVIDIAGTVLSVLYVHTYGRSVIILFGFEFGLLIFYTIN
eukprot:gene27873-31488_t